MLNGFPEATLTIYPGLELACGPAWEFQRKWPHFIQKNKNKHVPLRNGPTFADATVFLHKAKFKK